MRAVQVGAPGTATLVQLPEPTPGPGEMLVQVGTCAVCATDRKLAARGMDPARVPGHETAGWLADGTPVGVHPDTSCGRCAACRAGFENRCPDRISVGIDRDGGLAEWLAVPARHVVPLDGVDVQLAPLLEPLACCVQAVRLLDVRAGERAVVVGAGPMGILTAWTLRAAGASVGVVQRSEPRRRLAHRLDAGTVVAPDEDVAACLGGPPAVAVVTAPGAAALTWALERLDVGGRAHAFAGTPGGAAVDANLVHYRHLTLVGGTGSALADYRRARDLVRDGVVRLDRLPCGTVPLARVPEVLTGEHPPAELKVTVQVAD
jgi:threonine dehydrogenase-like Zn-dependent dehydrogenase